MQRLPAVEQDDFPRRAPWSEPQPILNVQPELWRLASKWSYGSLYEVFMECFRRWHGSVNPYGSVLERDYATWRHGGALPPYVTVVTRSLAGA